MLMGVSTLPTVGASDGGLGPHPDGDVAASDDTATVLGPEAALEMTARSLADEAGVSYEDALGLVEYQQRATGLLTQLSDDGLLESSFAGSEFVGDSAAMIWYFKGEPLADYPALAAQAGVGGVQIQTGQPYSLDELVDRQDAVHDAVVALGYENAYSYFDLASQAITVEVSDGPTLAVSAGAREASVRDAVADREGNIDVDLRIIDMPDGPRMELTHAHGGAWFRDDGVNECTSAFIASGSAGYRPLTAAHCEGLNQLADAGSGSSFSAP
ncbi:MAG: hypothetical protein D6688_12360 [Alphaproteobacteria bacterium]|nr:MAG: hypothetical protein D6688_12360 [Alphaproteobacteria bacterium]